jgi:hypothetical protein
VAFHCGLVGGTRNWNQTRALFSELGLAFGFVVIWSFCIALLLI